MLVGVASSSYQLLNNSLLMQEADSKYHGRVMSVVMLAWGFNGLVAYPFGRLADTFGERETLALMAGLVLTVSALTFAWYTMVSRRPISATTNAPAVDVPVGIGGAS